MGSSTTSKKVTTSNTGPTRTIDWNGKKHGYWPRKRKATSQPKES